MSNRALCTPGTSHEPDNLPPRFRGEVDYYLLNDGSDQEAEPEDRLPKVPRLDSESTIDGSVDNVAGTDVLPEESASQVREDKLVADSTSDTSTGSRARPVTSGSGHISQSQNYPISNSSIRTTNSELPASTLTQPNELASFDHLRQQRDTRSELMTL
ncbi:hypothetical protein V1527DRAFT_500612 [Lipomyces starkeyi]